MVGRATHCKKLGGHTSLFPGMARGCSWSTQVPNSPFLEVHWKRDPGIDATFSLGRVSRVFLRRVVQTIGQVAPPRSIRAKTARKSKTQSSQSGTIPAFFFPVLPPCVSSLYYCVCASLCIIRSELTCPCFVSSVSCSARHVALRFASIFHFHLPAPPCLSRFHEKGKPHRTPFFISRARIDTDRSAYHLSHPLPVKRPPRIPPQLISHSRHPVSRAAPGKPSCTNGYQ